MESPTVPAARAGAKLRRYRPLCQGMFSLNRQPRLSRMTTVMATIIGWAAVTASANVDFAKDVQPILETHCYRCHGPDEQESGLRLDLRAHALKGGENHGSPVQAGDSNASVLIRLVTAPDASEAMPPKGQRLTPHEVAILKQWIDEGALWPDDGSKVEERRVTHWSFQPIGEPKIPGGGAANPIDAFVQDKLRAKGLQPSLPADRRTLLRRLHMVVTGLPPTFEEVTAFEKDSDPQAYEKRVKALLGSPRYGEKWARHWLDVVRFADSHGFETNHERENAWRYRDYVIQAFNSDKPYDRFMFEQIAGDTVGEDVATGFIVAGPWDRVKGRDKNLQLMQRADELADIVNATGTTFLGMTLGCAKCHNHKFDPIPQTDFYAIQSVFSGVQHGERPMRGPDYEVKLAKARELEKQLRPIQAKLASLQPKAVLARSFVIDDEPGSSVGPTQCSVREILKPKAAKPVLYDPGAGRGQAQDPGDAARLPNLATSYRYFVGDGKAGTDCFAWQPKTQGRFRIWLSWGAWTSHAQDARYVLDHDGDPATKGDQAEIATVDQRTFADGRPAVPNERRWSGFKSAGVHELGHDSCILLRTGEKAAPTVADIILLEEVLNGETPSSATPHVRPPVSHRANIELFDPVVAKAVRFRVLATSNREACIDELEVFTAGAESTNVALAELGATATSGGDYPPSSKHKLSHVNDGQYGNSRSWIAKQEGGGAWVQIAFPKQHRIDRIIWSRDRSAEGRAFDDRLAVEYEIDVSEDGRTWRTVATSQDRLDQRFRGKIENIPSGTYLPRAEVARVADLRKQEARLVAQVQMLKSAPLVYAGKFEEPEPTRRLHRGDFLSPLEVVAPDGLSVLHDQLGSLNLKPDAPEQQRRLAFAKWLADPRNPLPARVMVNRLWHYVFGTGLVGTPSDFGVMGFRPTHPELLDWLAAEFIRSGWSVKRMQQIILTSATFQQASRPRDEAVEVDATSSLLWRYPPHRLEAEAIRDSVLSVSGSLDLRMEGPGFLLFEPNTNYARNWIPKTRFAAPDFRRMVYALKLRMEQDAIFGAFDIPDAGQVCPSRTASTTPIQALNLYNSEFIVEQSERLAQRAKQLAGPDLQDAIRNAFILAHARLPDAAELKDTAPFVAQHGLEALCRALLNSNEFLFIE